MQHFLFSEKLSFGYPRVFIKFDELIQDPKKVICLIDKNLELNLEEKYMTRKTKIDTFLSPQLKHHNIDLDNLPEKTPLIVENIIDLTSQLNSNKLTDTFDVLRSQFFEYQSLFYNEELTEHLRDLERVRLDLQVKESALEKASQTLQTQDERLNHLTHELHVRDQTLARAQHNLKAKNQELEQTNYNLRLYIQKLEAAEETVATKTMEVTQAKRNYQAKHQALLEKKRSLQEKDTELEQTKRELISIYLSNSWKLTRPLRQIKRIFK